MEEHCKNEFLTGPHSWPLKLHDVLSIGHKASFALAQIYNCCELLHGAGR